VLFARPETVLNYRRKKLFYFSFFLKNKKVEFVSDQNKVLLQVLQNFVEKMAFGTNGLIIQQLATLIPSKFPQNQSEKVVMDINVLIVDFLVL
jgi:hypothetical protein